MTTFVEIVIAPEEILPVLTGEQDVLPGRHGDIAVVKCQGVTVCKVRYMDGDKWRVEKVACTHPIHGVHDKYRDIHERIKACASAAKIPIPDTCPQCKGAEWLDPNSPEARQAVVMAANIGIFRGIEIPVKKNLQSVGAEDILDGLLSLPEPSGAAVPGRDRESPARLFSQEKES